MKSAIRANEWTEWEILQGKNADDTSARGVGSEEKGLFVLVPSTALSRTSRREEDEDGGGTEFADHLT